MRAERRDIKPDAQAFDKITIETVPRWKDSEFSGSEWRISSSIKFYRKGVMIHEDSCGSVKYAAILLASKLIHLEDGCVGDFAGERNICDQEGCSNIATTKAKKKFDYCREGHKSENQSNAYRLFCSSHNVRGDCGIDDSDSNYLYEKIDEGEKK